MTAPTLTPRSQPVELLTADQARPDNPEWHELRRAGVSASEIAAVVNLSPWESAFGLYWRKVHGWQVEETAEMRAGHYAEPVIAAWFADQHPELAVRHAGLYAHPDRTWQRATPDRLVCQDRLCGSCDVGLPTLCTCSEDLVALLECKYVIGGWDGWGEPGTDDIPVYYRAQGLWQIDTLGVDQVHFAAWHGAEFREYLVRRDERDLRILRTAARAFLDRLDAGDAPAINDGHPATIAALKRLHPSVEDVDIDVPVEFAEGYRRARQLARRAEDVVDRYQARARGLLGNGRRLMCNGRLVVSRSVFDQSTEIAELDSLDTDAPVVDRLNPGRAASYLLPKGGPR
jgi:putative phage-type endonuclease